MLRRVLLLCLLLRLLGGGGILTELRMEQHESQVLRHTRTIAGVDGRNKVGFGVGVGDLRL